MDEKFSKDIIEKIGYYVYNIDPRNGETFMLEKEKEISFWTLKASLKYEEDEDENNLKIKRIRDINNVGLDL